MKTSLQTLLREPVKIVALLTLAFAASFGFFSQTAEYMATTRLMAEAERNYRAVVSFRKPPQALTEVETQARHPGYEHLAFPGLLEKLRALPSVAGIESTYIFTGAASVQRVTPKGGWGAYDFGVVMAEVTVLAEAPAYIDGTSPDKDIFSIRARIDKLVADNMWGTPGGVPPLTEGESYTFDYIGFWSESPYYYTLRAEDIRAMKSGGRYLVYISNSISTDAEGKTTSEPNFYVYGKPQALDGVPAGYLTTPAFATQAREAELLDTARGTLSFCAVSDMRNLMKSAYGELFVVEGEGITAETVGDVCVISSRLAQHNGLGVGDTLTLSTRDDNDGTYRSLYVAQDFIRAAFRKGYFDLPVITAPLRIIGIYDEDGRTADTDPWAFDANTVFMPHSVLADHFSIQRTGLPEWVNSYGTKEISIVLRSVRDNGAFYQQSANLFAEYQLVPVVGDYGWSRLADSFEQSEALAILKIIAFGAAAVFSFVLLAYLLVLRKSGEYAVMRALGVGKRRAGGAIALAALTVGGAGCALGCAAGWVYTARMIARMAENLPAAPHLPLAGGVAVAGALLLTLLAAVWAFTARLSRKSPMDLLSTKR